MDASIAWLLTSPAWVQYRTRLDLLGQAHGDADVRAARQQMLAHPLVQALLAELAAWPGPALKRHNDASHLLHKLAFIADLGLCADDPGVAPVVSRIVEHRATEGPFPVLMNIATAFGGSGKDELVWALCDAPTVVYALVKLGLRQQAHVQAAQRYLAGLVRENGWLCAASPSLGRFHGPGRRSDPCPYATLVMLKLLAQSPEWNGGPEAQAGAEALLGLWERRKERRPYLFAMGSDFARLKGPLVWYDILHVLDVLAQFAWLHDDPRLQEMAGMVRAKADAAGRFTPESVYRAWAEWDFGQKREPSPWLTLVVQRMLRRVT